MVNFKYSVFTESSTRRATKSRNRILRSRQQVVVGWTRTTSVQMRVPRLSNISNAPCNFCVMLISRVACCSRYTLCTSCLYACIISSDGDFSRLFRVQSCSVFFFLRFIIIVVAFILYCTVPGHMDTVY